MSLLNRRQALKGVTLGTGSLVLSSLVDQLAAHATDAPIARKRFVFVMEGNGLPPEQLAPKGIERRARLSKGSDRLIDLSLAERDLPVSLEPLKPFKDRLTIVQGLSGRVCGGGHSNYFGALGAFPNLKEGTEIRGETIDCALARALPSIFPHVGLGITERVGDSIVYNCSAWGPKKAAPTQCRPDLAYNALFGSIAGKDGRQVHDGKANVMDFLRDDLKRLEGKLAGPEREKLQHYLESIEAMRQRQSRLNEIEDTLRKKGPVVGDKFGDKYRSEVETDRLDAHSDLATAALICGLTNVVTLTSGAGFAHLNITFRGLGIDLSKHMIGHQQSYQGKSWSELAQIIRRFHFDLIARMAKKLQAVPEGDGTMFDNTVFVYLSDAAEAHHSSCWEWPMVVLGNLGGKLKMGRYLDYPGYGQKGHRTINNLYTTLLHVAGKPRDLFGVADPALRDLDQKGPLSALLA